MNEQLILQALAAVMELTKFVRAATPRHEELFALMRQREAEGRELTAEDLATLEAQARAAVRGTP